MEIFGIEIDQKTAFVPIDYADLCALMDEFRRVGLYGDWMDSIWNAERGIGYGVCQYSHGFEAEWCDVSWYQERGYKICFVKELLEQHQIKVNMRDLDDLFA